MLKKLTRSLACVAVLACFGVQAAKVREISVQSTSGGMLQETLEEIVRMTVRTKVGAEFANAVLGDDIRQLTRTGKFEDVQVRLESAQDGSIHVIYVLTPHKVVRSVSINGNTEYKTKRLTKLLKLMTNQVLDDTVLAKDRSALLDKYRDGGYYGTEVTTDLTPSEDGTQVDVTYQIHEKPRFKLKGVAFEGNTETVFTQDELRDAIATKRQWWRYIFRFGNYFNEQLQPLDKDKLQALYGTKGYLDFAVKDVEVRPVDNGKWVQVVYIVEEGAPYSISSIVVAGNEKFSQEELLKETEGRVGQVYNSDTENSDLNRMKARYEDLGYLDMRMYAAHEKDEDNHKVAVVYRVYEGEPCRIRNINIVGNQVTQEKVIRRELSIHPDDLGDAGKIRTSKNRLRNLGYFNEVEIVPVVTEEQNLKDLRVELAERNTGNIALGAGFSTEDSVIGFVELTESNFDVRRLFEWPMNPKGAGQHFRSRVQVGSHVTNVMLSLTEPWFLDRRLELENSLFFRNRFEDEYDQRNIGGRMMLSWPLSFRVPGTDWHDDWKMGIGIQFENIRISDADTYDDDPADYDDVRGDFVRGRVVADEEDSYWANRLIMRLTRDRRNAVMFPTRGSVLTLQGEYVSEALGSYESYGKISLDVTRYFPIFRDYVLKLSADYSSTTGEEEAIFDRYFGGGIGTIRGFKRRDVAPVDCHKDPLGGSTLLMATAELLIPMKDIAYFSIFSDAGNVWWDAFETSLDDMNVSTGIGLQFKSLPVSMYYGYPVVKGYDHLEGRHGRFHFQIMYSY